MSTYLATQVKAMILINFDKFTEGYELYHHYY
jgi:hypothetical protein